MLVLVGGIIARDRESSALEIREVRIYHDSFKATVDQRCQHCRQAIYGTSAAD